MRFYGLCLATFAFQTALAQSSATVSVMDHVTCGNTHTPCRFGSVTIESAPPINNTGSLTLQQPPHSYSAPTDIGTRGRGVVYPPAGIPVSTGTAWSASINPSILAQQTGASFRGAIAAPAGMINGASICSLAAGCGGETGGGGMLSERDDLIDVYADLGCDPSGTIDCTSSLEAGIASHPNGTFLFSTPQGSTSATYLLAATASVTLPRTATLKFENGAKISTGHGTPGTISRINRTGLDTSTRTMSLAGCVGSVPQRLWESFSNCPNDFGFNDIVTLDGLTNVPNCYKGCVIQSVDYQSFWILNPAAQSVIGPARESGGTMVQKGGEREIDLSDPSITISSTPTSITVNMKNDLPAAPGLVTFMATPFAGSYELIPSSVTPTSFQLYCTRVCPPTSATKYSGGTILFNSTGYTGVQFSTPPRVGSGWIYCSGTNNFNGIYPVVASAPNTANAALEDMRATVPTETNGSCYSPYTLTIAGFVEASEGQQIVATGSAVSFAGQSEVYVGWYGAGHGDSVADTYGIQAALYMNPSHRVQMPKVTPGTTFISNTADYVLNDSIIMYGASQTLDGQVGSLDGSKDGATKVWCAHKSEPCIIMPPNAGGGIIQNLNLLGPNCANVGYANILAPVYSLAQDGILIGANEPKVDHIQESCMARNGINIVSHFGFGWTFSSPQPDYWEADNLFLNGNGGYGIAAYGLDSNGGKVDGNNWARGNVYGGYHSEVLMAGTYINANGDGNSNRGTGGSTYPIKSLTVTGTGINAVCTITPVNGAVGLWVVISGTNGSGGAVGTDGTWKMTDVTATNASYSCPGASGGPATGGTLRSASSDEVYQQLQTYPDGNGINFATVDGLIGGTMSSATIINPYSEGTNGCPHGNGLILGSPTLQIETELGGCTNGLSAYAGSGFSGAMLGVKSGALNVIASHGLTVNDGPVCASGTCSFGSTTVTNPTDLSKHISLWSQGSPGDGGYGFSITGYELNVVTAQRGYTAFYNGANPIAYIGGPGGSGGPTGLPNYIGAFFKVPVELPADPTLPLQAATKQYVDAHALGRGTVKARQANTTPAHSYSKCDPNEPMWHDANYIYVCVAENTIKRTLLSSF